MARRALAEAMCASGPRATISATRCTMSDLPMPGSAHQHGLPFAARENGLPYRNAKVPFRFEQRLLISRPTN
jgi:hypothetical protein